MSTLQYAVGGTRTSSKNLWILTDDGVSLSIIASYDIGTTANVVAIVKDTSGDLYIATSENKVYKYTGAFVLDTTWATNGIYTCLGTIRGIAVDSSGYLAIGCAKYGTTTVVLLNSTGTFVWGANFQSGTIQSTSKVAFNSSGNVVGLGSRGSGSNTGAIYQRSDGTGLGNYWVTGGAWSGNGLAICSDGDVVASASPVTSGNSRVYKCSSSDVQQFNVLLSPAAYGIYALVLDASENIYLGTQRTNSKTLYKVSAAGDVQSSYDTGAAVNGVCINLGGNLVVGGASSTDSDGHTAILRVLNTNLTVLLYTNDSSLGTISAICELALSPEITDQSDDTTTFEGQSVTLFVTASGTEPLSYQWYKDDTALSGEVSDTLSFYVDMSDAGIYKCIVTNVAGEVESGPIVLTIEENPNRWNLFSIYLDQDV